MDQGDNGEGLHVVQYCTVDTGHILYIIFDVYCTPTLVLKFPQTFQCNKDCGGGRQYRKVRCRQLLALGEVADTPDGRCPFPRPRDDRTCNAQLCSSYDYEKWMREEEENKGVASAAKVRQVG